MTKLVYLGAMNQAIRETQEAARADLIDPARAREIILTCRLLRLQVEAAVDRAGSQETSPPTVSAGRPGPVSDSQETRVLG